MKLLLTLQLKTNKSSTGSRRKIELLYNLKYQYLLLLKLQQCTQSE